ncbi:hypothetical protein KIP58_21660 [Xanthomonas campestris pv. campestris]|uniref:hypothetical protein n=1 Tax=Xanthomonas campestris TaxID=339 RepID=UPI001BB4DA11|nr:hypothetical protein [Xanthomonas campestris]MCF8861598.1 hypothetical protein [Xanthomonas campestris pv. campestris]QIW87508.1 hypothetical protein Ab1vBOLIVR3_gp98c [Agrobacterium phage OLIVR3]
MKLYIIIALIGAVIFMAAIEYGKHLSTRDAAINAQKQVIIQGKTNDKISNYSDNDFCTTVLGGQLSESGECK